MDAQRAIAKIEVTAGGKVIRRGTAFLAAQGLALTALHVVADRSKIRPAFYDGTITLYFTGHTTTATVVRDKWDRKADWVLLRCTDPPPIRPLLLDRDPGNAKEWETYGFPEAKPDGLTPKGEIQNPFGTVEGVRALELFSPQAAAGEGMPADGLSGAPVVIDEDTAVGLLRWCPKNEGGAVVAGTLFACPMSMILDLCPDELPAKQANPSDRRRAELLEYFHAQFGPDIASREQIAVLCTRLPPRAIPEKDSHAAYCETLPPGVRPRPRASTLGAMLGHLAEFPRQADNGGHPHLVLRCAELLASIVVDPQVQTTLRKWVADRGGEAGVDATAAPAKPARSSQWVLLVELTPDAVDEDVYDANFVCWRDREPMGSLFRTEHPLPRPDIQAALNEQLTAVENHIDDPAAELIVEFCLPHESLGWEVDQWLVEVGLGVQNRLGSYCPVVVRSQDRARKLENRLLRRWRANMGRLSAARPLGDDTALWIANGVDYPAERLAAVLKDRACVVLGFEPDFRPDSGVQPWLNQILAAGIPVILWPRQAQLDCPALTGKLRELLVGKGGDQLPHVILAYRNQVAARLPGEPVAFQLSLLWDDPERLPPCSAPLTPPSR